jgi:predicted metalloprotease with PDZ domain
MRRPNFEAGTDRRSGDPRRGAWPTYAWVWVALCAALLCLSQSCQSAPAADDEPFDRLVGQAPGPDVDQPAKRRGALWYQLDTHAERVDVHVRLLNPPDRSSFFLPGRWAGRADFAENISITGAHADSGPVPFTISRSEGRIDIEADGAGWIQLDYSVKLRDQADGERRFHPRYGDGVLFAYGPAFIVLPSEQISEQVRDIPIEVRTPEGWSVLTTWHHAQSRPSKAVAGATVHGYVAATPAVLRDAFVATGPDLEVHRQTSDPDASPLTVGFSPGAELDRRELGEQIEQIVAAFRRRFGDLGAVTAYVRATEGAHDGRGRGVGRRGGFVVELPPGQPLDDQGLLLVAHEAFHLWNGHHLTPRPAQEKQTRWFKEGVTHYVALQMLVELGLLSRDDVLAELARSASYYQRNPAARSAVATPADFGRLPYDRGVLLAVGLDAALLRDSGGEVGVQTWVGHLIERFGDRDQKYAQSDLRAALVAVSRGADSPAVHLWDASVDSLEPLEPAELFELAGLHWLDGPNRPRTRLLPVKQADSPLDAMFPTP